MKRFLFALLLMCCVPLLAQEDELLCGFEATEKHEEILNLMKSNMIALDVPQVSTPTSFPITAHIIRTSSGFTGLTESALNTAINIMNDYYANANVEFFLCGEFTHPDTGEPTNINYIDNDEYYSLSTSEEAAVASGNDVPNTINIYFANTVSNSSGASLCGYAYYPGGPSRIVMANGCTTNGSTLSHEMGHYFGLFHTHGTSNVKNSTNELADGSNGDSTGDRIADTPSDPQLSGEVNNSFDCEYIGNYLDNNNQPHVPDPHNIMSYSRKQCRDFFSDGQYALIYNISISSRANLACPDISANFSSSAPNACVGPHTVNFEDNSNGAVEWAWDIDGDGVTDYTEQNPTHFYQNDGSYDVSLTVKNADGLAVSKTIPKYVNIGGDGIDTESVNIEINLDNWESETAWTLKDNDGNIIAEDSYQEGQNVNNPFTYNVSVDPGECYTFEITDSYGDGICCTSGQGSYTVSTDDGAIIATGGDFQDVDSARFKIEDASLSIGEVNPDDVTVYPNPFTDKINITGIVVNTYKIYNLQGQLLLEGDNSEINTSNISNGIYIIKINDNVIKKIIK